MDTAIRLVENILFLLVIYKLIFEKDKEKCFYWYVCGSILLYPLMKLPVIPQPPILLPLICIIRAYRAKELKELWKIYPLRILTLAMLVYHIVHPFIASWMPLISAIRFELYGFSQTYLVVLGGYLVAPTIFTRSHFQRCLMFISVILIITGMMTWMMSNNFIAAAFSTTGDSFFGSDRVGTERGFRATGPAFSPNSYGNSLVLCILLVNHYIKKPTLKIPLILGLLLCIVFTASRAPVFIFAVGLCIYYLFQKKSKLVLAVAVVYIGFIIFGEALSNNEYIGKYVAGITDLILTGGQNTDGSSSELREFQWLTTLNYLEEAPVWGHGEGYTMELVNESGRFFHLKDAYIAGAEGYQYITLIDYGVSYMILALAFFIRLICYFAKKIRNRDYTEMALWGLCFTMCLFVFLMSSRPNQIWQVYFPFVGLCLKIIVYHQNKKIIHEHNISMR